MQLRASDGTQDHAGHQQQTSRSRGQRDAGIAGPACSRGDSTRRTSETGESTQLRLARPARQLRDAPAARDLAYTQGASAIYGGHP